MSQSQPSGSIFRRIWAVLAGLLAIIVLSVGTDVLMSATGIFPPHGRSMSDPLYLLATIYRTVYGIVGSYLAARLAPEQPMFYALILGFIGFALSLLGAVTMWNQPAVRGHEWYPLALVILAIPSAWLGGRIRTRLSSVHLTASEVAR